MISGLCALRVVSTSSGDNVTERDALTSAGEGPSGLLSVAGPSALLDIEAGGPGRVDATPSTHASLF